MSNETQYEDMIRTGAYFLWVEEGRPEGCALAHWNRAVELVAKDVGPSNAPVVSSTSGRRTAPAGRRPRSKAAKKSPSADQA